MRRFPKDCDINCEHYSQYDMSVDDYVATCDKIGISCDLCEGDYCFYLCPLTKDGEK
jgi:predicted transcriptional regulator